MKGQEKVNEEKNSPPTCFLPKPSLSPTAPKCQSDGTFMDFSSYVFYILLSGETVHYTDYRSTNNPFHLFKQAKLINYVRK